MRIKRTIARLNAMPPKHYCKWYCSMYPSHKRESHHVMGKAEFCRRLREDLDAHKHG